MKEFLRRSISVLTAFVLMLGMVTLPSVSAAPMNIAVFNANGVTPAPDFPFNANGVGTHAGTSVLTAIPNNSTATANTFNQSNWVVDGKHWLITTSSKGFENVTVSFNVIGSNTGPANWVMTYSVTDTAPASFLPVNENEITYAVTGTMSNRTISLPAGANNADVLYIKMAPANNTAISGTIGSGGTNRMQTITISGTSGEGFVCPACDDEDCDGSCCKDCDDPDCDGSCCKNCDDPDCDGNCAVIPISEAITKSKGTIVTVEGVLTYNTVTNAGLDNGVYMQDGSGAGINVRPSTNTADRTAVKNLIGKKVKVTGRINNFSGLVQIEPAVADVVVTDENPTLPTHVVATATQINAQTFPFMLVTLENVKLTNIITTGTVVQGNHTVEQNGVTVTVQAPLTLRDKFSQDDYVTIKGVATVMQNVTLIYVNSLDDIVAGEAPKAPSGTDGIDTLARWSATPSIQNVTSAEADMGIYFENASISTSTGGTFSRTATAPGSFWFTHSGQLSWQMVLSTEGMSNVNLSFGTYSSAVGGGGDWEVQYSTNGTNFSAFVPPVKYANTATGNNINNANAHSINLPSDVDDKEKLFIRLIPDAGKSGNARLVLPITISGHHILEENQLRHVSSDTPSGEVGAGDTVTFSPNSLDRSEGLPDGYVIELSQTGTAPWTPLGADYKFVIEELPLTLFARANATGMLPSRAIKFVYDAGKLNQVTARRNYAGTHLTLSHTVEGAEIFYRIKEGNDYESNFGPEHLYTEPIILNPSWKYEITAYAKKFGWEDSDKAIFIFDTVKTGGEQIYFGQLHSHSTLSDGIGEVEEAYRYARDDAKLDFFAVTDHSNSFGGDGSEGNFATDKNINDFNRTNANWQRGLNAAANSFRDGEFISFYGFEMTWSGGPGHINTFNTEGFVSRNNAALNNKTNDAGMRLYYELLQNTPGSISMFNHPGTTFGNFRNFAYHDPVVNQFITLLEVGNGEGAIGSGYWPSYDQFNLALDKGWKLAPVNSQDNHQGKWGNSNTARTAIWTNDLSLQGVYKALRDMRVYSTEVADLEIEFFVNGEPLGSVIEIMPTTAIFEAEIKNPTAGNTIKSVGLVTNGGREIQIDNPGSQNHSYKKTIASPAPGYYYLRVVVATPQGDRIAVTAPVWLGEGKMAGFDEVTNSAVMPVTEEELTFTASLFNDEDRPAELLSLEYKQSNGNIIGSAQPATINSKGTFSHTQTFTPTVPGRETVTLTAVMKFADGVERTYTYEVAFNVRDAAKLRYVGIDASNSNAYIAGRYVNAMNNFIQLAADMNLRSVMLRTEAEVLSAAQDPRYAMLVFSPPDRHNTIANQTAYTPAVVAATGNFAKNGGIVIVNSISNFNDTGAIAAMRTENNIIAGQQNQLLAAMGSSLRVSEYASYDRSRFVGSNTHQPTLTAADNYNFSHPLLKDVVVGQQFSSFSGATLYAVDNNGATITDINNIPQSVQPMVWGNATTYASDQNNNAWRNWTPVMPPRYGNQADGGEGAGRLLMAATETFEGGGLVIVTSCVFQSDFEVRTPDNAAELPFSNYNISVNLLNSAAPPIDIATIANVWAADSGEFTVEGIVTSGVHTSGTDPNNKGFFDSIYIQDATRGINLFPVASGVEVGQRVRVTGTVGEFEGEKQLTVSQITVIDSAINAVSPKIVSAAQAMSPSETGTLVRTEGIVSDIRTAGGVISQFTLTDNSGAEALVFINAYITSGTDLSFVEDGARIRVVGLASVGSTEDGILPRIRVRDRNEIAKIPDVPPTGVPGVTEHLIAMLVLLAASAGLWVYTLRRRKRFN